MEGNMTYQEYKAKRQSEFNKLPIFSAFSDKQFEEEMQKRGLTSGDTDKIYRLGASSFYLRSDAPLIREFMRQEDKLLELMKDEKFAVSAFKYEMDNHEYSINWQGDWEVCNVFSKYDLEYGEEKTYEDYLKEADLEFLVPSYSEAKSQHIRAAVEEGWF